MKSVVLKTPFNVNISANSDVVFKRLIAYFIDLFVMFCYLFVVMRLLSFFNIDNYQDLGGDYNRFYWGIMSVVFLPIMFYTLFFETLTGGQTIGKIIMRIRVIKAMGYRPSFVDFFMRWIVRLVEFYPFVIAFIIFNEEWAAVFIMFTGWVALLVMAISKHGQRLGDLISNTAVVSLTQKEDISITILKNVDEDYVPVFPEVIKLSDNDMRIIKDTYTQSLRFDDYTTIAKLREKVEAVTGIKSDQFDDVFFENIFKDFNFYTKKD